MQVLALFVLAVLVSAMLLWLSATLHDAVLNTAHGSVPRARSGATLLAGLGWWWPQLALVALPQGAGNLDMAWPALGLGLAWATMVLTALALRPQHKQPLGQHLIFGLLAALMMLGLGFLATVGHGLAGLARLRIVVEALGLPWLGVGGLILIRGQTVPAVFGRLLLAFATALCSVVVILFVEPAANFAELPNLMVAHLVVLALVGVGVLLLGVARRNALMQVKANSREVANR